MIGMPLYLIKNGSISYFCNLFFQSHSLYIQAVELESSKSFLSSLAPSISVLSILNLILFYNGHHSSPLLSCQIIQNSLNWPPGSQFCPVWLYSIIHPYTWDFWLISTLSDHSKGFSIAFKASSHLLTSQVHQSEFLFMFPIQDTELPYVPWSHWISLF